MPLLLHVLWSGSHLWNEKDKKLTHFCTNFTAKLQNIFRGDIGNLEGIASSAQLYIYVYTKEINQEPFFYSRKSLNKSSADQPYC